MAVNPHAETYQGKTQFSGPVKAGTRWNGANAAYKDLEVVANPIAVSKLANAGYVVCSQSCAIEDTSGYETLTDITLPPYSMLISIQVIVTVAWSATRTMRVGAQPETTSRSFTANTVVDAVGAYNLVPGNDADRCARWKNVNDIEDQPDGLSLDVWYSGSGSTPGKGILTINYIPGVNL